MLQPLKQRTLEYEEWTGRANKIVKGENEDLVNINDVQALLDESKNKLYPINTEIYESLKSLLEELKKSTPPKRQNDHGHKKSPSNKKLKVDVNGKCSSSSVLHSPQPSLSSLSSQSSSSSFGICKNETTDSRDGHCSKSKKMKKS